MKKMALILLLLTSAHLYGQDPKNVSWELNVEKHLESVENKMRAENKKEKHIEMFIEILKDSVKKGASIEVKNGKLKLFRGRKAASWKFKIINAVYNKGDYEYVLSWEDKPPFTLTLQSLGSGLYKASEDSEEINDFDHTYWQITK